MAKPSTAKPFPKLEDVLEDGRSFIPEIRFLLYGFRLMGIELDKIEHSPAVVALMMLWRIFLCCLLGIQLLGRMVCAGMVFLGPYGKLGSFMEKCAWFGLMVFNAELFVFSIKLCFDSRGVSRLFASLSREVRIIATEEVVLRTRKLVRRSSTTTVFMTFVTIVLLMNGLWLADFDDEVYLDKILAKMVSDKIIGRPLHLFMYVVNIVGIGAMLVLRSFYGMLFLSLCRISESLFDTLFVDETGGRTSVDLGRLVRRHWSLCDLVQKVNNVYQWLLLSVIMTESMGIILYTVVIVDDSTRRGNTADLTIRTFDIMVEMSILSLVLLFISKANERIKTSLANDAIIAQCRNERYEEVHEAYHLYINQINDGRIGISCGNMFFLDKSYGFTIIGSMITYLTTIHQKKKLYDAMTN